MVKTIGFTPPTWGGNPDLPRGGESLNLYSDWTARTPAKQCKNSAKQSKNFVLQTVSVAVPDCEVVFATDSLAHTPNTTKDTPVETDLHRVLPHPALRAALIAMCLAGLPTLRGIAAPSSKIRWFHTWRSHLQKSHSPRSSHTQCWHPVAKLEAHYLDRALLL